MNPIPKTKIIRLKGQKLAKLNERIHQRDQHKCIYCGNRVDPGEKFHHEHNGIKSDQIEYGVLLCMDCCVWTATQNDTTAKSAMM